MTRTSAPGRCASAWVYPGDGFVGGSISVDPEGNI